MVKKIGLILLIMSMIVSCMGCQTIHNTEVQATTEPATSVIDQRRDAAEQYMRAMATYMWRAEEDINYTRSNSVLTEEDLAAYEGNESLSIKAGRLYRGIPYSYTGASAWNFYDYATEPDEQGISTLQNVHWRMLNGSSAIGATLGNDCSGAIQLAWNYVGGNIQLNNTKSMTPMYGYLRVGQYKSPDTEYTDTTLDCAANGLEVMSAAYALLQKADAVVKRIPSYGHTMMVVENHPVYKEDGTLDPEGSYITVLHQTSSYMKKEEKFFDETYGEDVYIIYGIDDKYTYATLFTQGYFPITCDALVDPAPVAEVYVRDTEKEHSFHNILSGRFVSNRILSAVTITITNEAGEVVMEGTCYEVRQTKQAIFSFDLSRFTTQPAHLQRGCVDPQALDPGNYHCTHTVRDGHGVSYTMRDFDFTVS